MLNRGALIEAGSAPIDGPAPEGLRCDLAGEWPGAEELAKKIFAQPAVLQQHRRRSALSQALASIEQDDLQNRCRFEAHDMFESVPTGGDVYLLRSILDDWNDDESRRIFKTVPTAMLPAAAC